MMNVQATLDSGSKEKMFVKDGAVKHILMEPCMRATGRTTKRMAKAGRLMQKGMCVKQEMYIKAIGKMVNNMVMEFSFMLMEHTTRASSGNPCSMA